MTNRKEVPSLPREFSGRWQSVVQQKANRRGKDFMRSVFKPTVLMALLLVTGALAQPELAQEKDKIALPVDSEKSFERSTFPSDEHQVWTLLVRILTDHGFEFLIKDKSLGRIETSYIVFSRHREFSKLSNGVKSLAQPPRLFLRKRTDGMIKVLAQVRSLSQNSTEVVLRPDIF